MEDIKHFSRFKIFQAGTGGTGGYLAMILSKFIADIAKHKNFDIDYVLYDKDIVEPKNLIRQNFLSEDVGLNKAEVIAKRYGIKKYVPSFLTSNFIDMESIEPEKGVNIILGCTDSVSFRIDMAKFLKYSDPSDILWLYIDGGNLDISGQVMAMTNLDEAVYSKDMDDIEEIFSTYEDSEEAVDEASLSCNNMGDQTIGMNLTSAIYMYNMVTEFIASSRLSCNSIKFRRYETIFNYDINMAIENQAY